MNRELLMLGRRLTMFMIVVGLFVVIPDAALAQEAATPDSLFGEDTGQSGIRALRSPL